MARRARQPFSRSEVFPVEEPWQASPGLTVPVVRFAVAASVGSVGQPDSAFVATGAFLAPEVPLSILPYFLRGFATPSSLPEAWRSRPVPPWRGVPCRFGMVAVRFLNLLEGE